MAAKEREMETHRLLGMASPTFHLGYGPAVNFMGELLVIMTETTGIHLPTAGGLSVCECVCVCVWCEYVYMWCVLNTWVCLAFYAELLNKFKTHKIT